MVVIINIMRNNPVNLSSGKTHSYWVKHPAEFKYPALAENISVDVLIIGGGMSGLSCAYELLKNNKSVALIEDGILGSGESSRTSAHLSSCLDYRYYELIDKFGLDNARLAAQSHVEAIDAIEQNIHDEKINCNFKRVNGYLFIDRNQNSLEELEKEAQALEKIGNLSFEWAERAPFKRFDTGPCLKFLNQGQFDPMKYLEGLTQAIINRGGYIFESTHARDIKDGEPCEVTTSDGNIIRARDIIITTGSLINDRVLIQTKLAQYRTYAIIISLSHGDIEEALYWDTLDPYHYVRLVPSADQGLNYILIGGKDHKTGQNQDPEQAFLDLEKWAKENFNSHKALFRWSGQVVEPVDGLAYTGLNPSDKHIYVHTSHSGNGLTYAAIASKLLTNLILNKTTPYEELYDPRRKNLHSTPDYVEENCNTAAQYADWFKASECYIDAIPRNQGAIVRQGLTPKAIYKDEHGQIYYLSAVCPHLGGIVRWNDVEKSWDCPCHGSRFNSTGEVVNGPANRGLKKIKPRE